jgi:gamma-glutamylcysteine synthetase
LRLLFIKLRNLHKDLDKCIKRKIIRIFKEKYTSYSISSIVEVKKDKVKSKSKSPIVIAKKDNKYTKDECDKWKLNKLVNPITNRKIQEGKPTYNDFKKHCTDKSKSPIVEVKKDKVKSKSPIVIAKKDNKYTKDECDKWNANKLVNPKTNRNIQEGKPTYNDFKKHCL